jgi:hypothetical protein
MALYLYLRLCGPRLGGFRRVTIQANLIGYLTLVNW